MNAVTAHVGGEYLKQGDITHRIHETADAGEAERNSVLCSGPELRWCGHRRESASLAAL
jgi:hypothetical protein